MENINFFNAFTAPYIILFHIAMFFVMNEYREPRRKAAFLTALLNLPIIALTIIIYFLFGSEKGGQFALLFYIIPQISVCVYLSRYRDGRVFSTYFFVSGINIFIIQMSNLIDYYLSKESHIAMFLIRLLSYPVVLFFMAKFLAKPYRRAMNVLRTGWNLFAYISGMHVLMLTIIFNFPNTLAKRPYDIPILVLTFGVMLLTNLYYIETMMKQRDYYYKQEESRFLELQLQIMQQKIEQTAEAEKSISIYRHDMRHVLSVINGMLTEGQTEAALSYIRKSTDAVEVAAVRKWCKNPVLNAMFQAYFSEAEKQEIHIDAKIELSELPDEETIALSLVFANAIENAVHAAVLLPEGERIIRVRALAYPNYMFSVSNPYSGDIIFDEDGIPTSDKEGHGIGIRSILAYCEKYRASCDFKIKDGWFTIRIVKK